jgi:hypothetical protein
MSILAILILHSGASKTTPSFVNVAKNGSISLSPAEDPSYLRGLSRSNLAFLMSLRMNPLIQMRGKELRGGKPIERLHRRNQDLPPHSSEHTQPSAVGAFGVIPDASLSLMR